MLWGPSLDILPGVKRFMTRLRDGLICAHDAILTQCTKQSFHENQRRRLAPFIVGDLAYLSTENLSLAKGRAQKLVPKYIGPYRITAEVSPNTTFRLVLPPDLLSRGIHPVFHSSLLRIHIPNDDCQFPGWSFQQVTDLVSVQTEHEVRQILTHFGRARHAWFKVEWVSGDKTWLPYRDVKHLAALEVYLENQGFNVIETLPSGTGTPPDEVCDQVDFPEPILDSEERTDTNLDSIGLCHDSHKSRCSGGYIHTPTCKLHNMPYIKSNDAIMEFYKHLIQLNDSAVAGSLADRMGLLDAHDTELNQVLLGE
jgi:hypothetical protein